MNFTVPYEALCVAYDLDVESHDTDIPLNWIELLAYTATKNGGTFSNESARFITPTATDLSNRSTTMKKLTKDLKNHDYFLEAYTAGVSASAVLIKGAAITTPIYARIPLFRRV